LATHELSMSIKQCERVLKNVCATARYLGLNPNNYDLCKLPVSQFSINKMQVMMTVMAMELCND
jgi:acetolactate synthase small subunit